MEYMSTEGEVRSALEYQQSCTVTGDVAQLQISDATFYQRGKKPDKKKESKANKTDDFSVPAEVELSAKTSTTNKPEADTNDKISCTDHIVKAASADSKPRVPDRTAKKPDCTPTVSATASSVSDAAEKENVKSREDLESEIKSFLVKKGKEKLAFPPSLSSQERFYVHSIAEELGVEHESKGEGDQRYIVVRKRSEKRGEKGKRVIQNESENQLSE